MTTHDRFDHDLTAWLDAETSVRAPSGLHADAIERARGARQRPGWLVAARGGTIRTAPRLVFDRRALTLLAVLGLVLAGLIAALVVGALRTDRSPLGANGPIEFTYQGNNHGAGGTRQVAPDGTGDQAPSESGGCARFSRNGGVRVVAAGDSAFTTFLVTDARTGAVAAPITAEYLDYSWHPHFGSYDISPDGTRLAWAKGLNATGDRPAREIWVSRLDDGTATLLVAASDDPLVRYGVPVWSPDGRSLAFETWIVTPDGGPSYRSGVHVVDVDTRGVRRLSSRAVATAAGLSWSPDGRWLAFVGQPDGVPIPTPDVEAGAPDPMAAGDVFLVRAEGGNERNLTSSAAFEQWPAWSPDGTRLGYLASEDGESYRVTTVAMDGPTPVGSTAHGPESEFLVWSPDGTRLLWVEAGPVATGNGTLSTIHAIDRDLRGPSSTVTTVQGSMQCAPSWRSVDRP